MANPALGAVGFIFGTLLNLYAMIVALRFVMQVTRADYYNPFAQFVVKATDPLIVPLRRVVPSIKRYDTSSLLLCFIVLFLKLLLFKALSLGAVHAMGQSVIITAIPLITLFLVAFVDIVHLFFNIFIYSMFIMALLSWIPSAAGHPVQGLLRSITDPVLNPIRRILPPIGGLDLSVMAAIIGMFALQMFVVGTLQNLLLR